MTPNTSTIVRDIAIEIPGATRIFEGLKIDYCCGGERSLQDACEIAGVDTADVRRLLNEARHAQATSGETIDFQAASLTELITYILDNHHVFTKGEMKRLDALVERVCAVHGTNHAELLRVRALFQEVCEDLGPHMMKEENVLFPYIIRLEEAAIRKATSPAPPFGTVRNPVRMMMMEHDTVGELLRTLRELTSDYSVPADGCISYRTLFQALEAFERDLHQHIHLENNILFPRAVAMEDAVYSRTA